VFWLIEHLPRACHWLLSISFIHRGHTTWPTRSLQLRWPARMVSRRAPSPTAYGTSSPTRSKATNPHAAAASLSAFRPVVWIAGGQLKDAPVEDLVRMCADRLLGVVLLGVDRDQIRAALTRHAPRVPVIEVESHDDEAMTQVVQAAAELARPGSTVLLAPAAASYDMFTGYAARGDAFAAAVQALGSG
jgi:UDP-N-acetylmuramoylalanine--D-glutamate ligase